MELSRRASSEHADPGRNRKSGGPGGKGDDRAVRAKKLAVEEPKSWLFKVK